MAALKITLLLMVVVSVVDAGVSISPSMPRYLPVPAPNSYPAVPALPEPYPDSNHPPVPASPVPSPDSYPAVPATQPIPIPIASPPPPSSPVPSPILYPPESAGPVPAHISYPPESASPVPAPVSSSPPTLSPMPSPIPPSRGIKGAYWPSFDGFPASAIDTSYFTHLYYAFLLPDPITYELAITQYDLDKLAEFTGALHAHNPPVKTLLSIGGGGNDPKVFSKIASGCSTRAIFINSTINVARKYGFDGVDLDWEFPANQEDMANLALLFSDWRKALVKEAKATARPRLLLTSAVYFASKFFFGEPRSYPGDSIRQNVDWVSPMCFDYHGTWDTTTTGEHAALYDPHSNISTSFGLQSWIDAGVPPKKVVMGLPLYGRTWRLKDPSVNGIGAPAVGVGPGSGILVYSEVVDFNNENNATVKYDGETVSMYSFSGDSWIGYDDVQSIKVKIQFARSHGLGGYFFWALGQDKDWTISRQAWNSWEY
ncbi:hypothetical protein HHK36_013848 [Tetracentron sinense]|uniref:GH18 domain-containing protein n=1 Tax=Tetracentron sinense TaxID=13715 RepID=A0A835DHR3_TETSI|nr:hypothetical protein HHK36_013848 [Tetracentron sinense]